MHLALLSRPVMADDPGMVSKETGAAVQKLGHRPGLDSVRAVAVLSVVAAHWNIAGRFGIVGAWVGVDLFFVLSGFLITTLLLEEAAGGPVSLRRFYGRRARRLLPALVVFLVVCVAWVVTVGSEQMRAATLAGAVSAAGYVANFVATDYMVDLTSHTWSLAVEEHFYLLWPAVLAVMFRWRGTRGVLHAALAGAAVAVVLRLTVPAGASSLYTHSQFRADGLLVGCALAAWVRMHGLPAWRRVAACAGTAWLCVVFVAGGSTAPWMQAWGYTVNAVAAAAVIAWAVTATGPLTHPALTRIGAISYGIYLWHNAIGKALEPYLHGVPLGVRVVVLAAVTFAICTLSYELIEQPIRRRGLCERERGGAVDPQIVERHGVAGGAGTAMGGRRDEVVGGGHRERCGGPEIQPGHTVDRHLEGERVGGGPLAAQQHQPWGVPFGREGADLSGRRERRERARPGASRVTARSG